MFTVMIGSSVYTPIAIPQVIEERFDTLLAKAEAIPDPIEQSFFVMVHLPYLQPFIDVNKRTSRLAANIPLIRANLCPLSFVDVPEARSQERPESDGGATAPRTLTPGAVRSGLSTSPPSAETGPRAENPAIVGDDAPAAGLGSSRAVARDPARRT